MTNQAHFAGTVWVSLLHSANHANVATATGGRPDTDRATDSNNKQKCRPDIFLYFGPLRSQHNNGSL